MSTLELPKHAKNSSGRTVAFLRKRRVPLLLVGSAIILLAIVLFRPPNTVGPNDSGELDAKKQQYIWDTEHITFEIETHLGKPFAKALKERNTEQLKRFLRDGFQATVLGIGDGEVIRHSLVVETRKSSDSANGKNVDAAEFVQSLVDSLSSFSEIARTRLRVLKIDQDPNNSSEWRSTILITADGIDSGSKPIHWESEHHIEYSFTDEAEIRSGPVIDRWQVRSESLRLSQRMLMEEVTGQTGLSELPILDNWKLLHVAVQQYRLQTAVADFNADGFLDIAVGTIEGRPLLLKSASGKQFDDVTDAVGIKSWQGDHNLLTALAAWIDFDNDGFPDLILGNRLYRNLKGEQFVEVTAESGLEFGRDPMGCAVVDYDVDGDLDLYLLYQTPTNNDHRGQSVAPWVGDALSGQSNRLWRNDGNGRFIDVTDESGTGGGLRHTFAAAWFFYDDDHYPDLYIANDVGHNVLLRNRSDGTFEDISDLTGTRDFATSMGVCTGDLDNDGHADIYVANMYSKMGRRIIGQVDADDYAPGIFEQIQGSCIGNRLYRKAAGRNGYEEVSEEMGVNAVGWAYAPAMVDLDGDGWLDIYATTGFMSFSREKPDG